MSVASASNWTSVRAVVRRKDARAALLRRVEAPRIDVVEISHHGSADQDPELYRRLHPIVGMIDVGADDRYGHRPATLLSTMAALGVVVGRTDTDGDLAVSMSQGDLTLWRARPPG
ncbi:hypothetical protein NS220_00970 [Microbacterium testaceum]|uniref:Uncharacterized protein n=1 Tax=Microbacterium testaceum TaxID=2033 RepID=A0A147F1B5_MICTE|nr:hypothetical protein [Microbacterium testaceum]KTR96702.1 hypothetical protein NS220_00970 [Microbacterium testaceum]